LYPHHYDVFRYGWGSIMQIVEDNTGKLWLATPGELMRFNPVSNTYDYFKNDFLNKNSISYNSISSLFIDRTGILWVGTAGMGINIYDPKANRFSTLSIKNNPSSRITGFSVRTVMQENNDIFWISTDVLYRWNRKTGEIKSYETDSNRPDDFGNTGPWSIIKSYDGKTWMATTEGLFRYDSLTKKARQYKFNKVDSTGLPQKEVFAVFEDNQKNIWAATENYFCKLVDIDKGIFQSYRYQASLPYNQRVRPVIYQDSKGKYWLGTRKGLLLFDLQTKTFLTYNNDPAKTNSLNNDNINSICPDPSNPDKILWLGTSGGGLNKFSIDDGTVKHFTEKDGLPNNVVYGILPDGKGNLWLSTNNGLSRFNPKSESFRNYYSSDGLQSNEFNQNAFAKDFKTGNLLFGGPNGFNVFNPNSLKDNDYLPPVVFTNYLRFNTDDEEGKPIVEKGISVRDSIFLTYKDNIITLDFAALSFLNNTKNQYKYKLEGFNENWIQLGNNHTVTFTNLSAGDYNLRVIGSNNDGLWNDEGANLFIHVSPPWWKTNIAFGIYFIAFFGFLYGVRRVEINRREQKAQIRESALRIKATEAEKRTLEIENERKTKELEEARQLQLSMLPKELPQLPNLEIAAFMRTATEVGGDYYDFMVQDDGVLNVAFGDATGHGLQAGTMVTLMKGFFTADSSKLGLKDFMSHCSRVIKDIKLGRILMSFSYLKIDSNKLSITSAGMPPIYYYQRETKQVEEIIIKGMPLGAMRNASYNILEKEIKSGDTILLLTDGLPEQMNINEEMFDYSRVKKSFNDIAEYSPDKIIEKLVEAGDGWMNGRQQDDDITFVVIRVK
jgi:serine phosphatase RsbU (regulator of sigma subunit)/ligand-binding sensor domain-containing protein